MDFYLYETSELPAIEIDDWLVLGISRFGASVKITESANSFRLYSGYWFCWIVACAYWIVEVEEGSVCDEDWLDSYIWGGGKSVKRTDS